MDHAYSLEERIAAALDRFSPKQKQLARHMLDNKYLVSFASANQVGESVGCSAATVVRFAQSLGYEGFSELRNNADMRSAAKSSAHINRNSVRFLKIERF